MDFAHYQTPKFLGSSPPITNITNKQSDGYLECLAQEAKKSDTAFMDIIKEFPVL